MGRELFDVLPQILNRIEVGESAGSWTFVRRLACAAKNCTNMTLRSTAALRVAWRLSALWPVAHLGIVVPKPVRDAIYRIIAQNRYKWFGQRAECMLPTPEVKERFLQAEGAS